MPKLRNALFKLYTPLVRWSPDLFLNILKHNHLDLLVSRMEVGMSFGFNNQTLPREIRGFEDLVFLFWSTPVNRGIIRQDLDEAAALYRLISHMEAPVGVEIGRFSGGSTILLAAAVGEMGRLISIDIDPQDDERLAGILAGYGFSQRVRLLTGDANDLVLEEDKRLDFVFIDGDHRYEGARRDHNKWGAKVKNNGFIIHHDMGLGRRYATQHTQLARLKSDILRTQANQLKLILEVGSMCFFRRQSAEWVAV